MKRIALSVVFLAALGVAPAWAADPPPKVVQGVKLSRLCDHCAVVTAVKSEKRKGEASGVGAVGGAVVGGVVGKSATDSTAGTIGGAAIGGVIGHQIEKRAKSHRVWVTTVTRKDGTVKKFEAASDPGWKPGTVVEVGADNKLSKRG